MEKIALHFLYPAVIFTSPHPCEVSTVLGSCVSICLWDTQLRIGGINHFMLPLWSGEGLASPKYGNIATEKLLYKMLEMRSDRRNLIAKVFGGANQLEKEGSIFNVGERNSTMAFDLLNDLGISVVSYSIGGEKGRRIKFCTHTGEVLMKYV